MRMPEIPIGDYIEAGVSWMRSNLTFVFDAITWVIRVLIDTATWLFSTPHWMVMLAIFVVFAFWARGWKFALFTLAGLLIVDSMRLWEETMDTLALAVVATFLAAAIGIPVGILAARNDRVSAVVRPILDFMQTLPVFVYLIPALFFFGVGIIPALVATFIFATAPSVRLTELGIRQVDGEMTEASTAFGATPGQMLRQVQLPLALPSIMAGINQSIMMALSMVVIASMVGSGGLGAVVLRGVQSMDVAIGFQGGLAVVFVAIFLDRITGAFPRPTKAKKFRGSTPEQEDDEVEAAQHMQKAGA